MVTLRFNGEPALPIKASGEIWHEGWDIPTRWAIDASNQTWADDAHGFRLNLVEPYILANQADENYDLKAALKDHLGLEFRPTLREQNIELRAYITRLEDVIMSLDSTTDLSTIRVEIERARKAIPEGTRWA